MKFINEFEEGLDDIIVAITGDGSREEKLLKAFSQKFGSDNKAIYWPRSPFKSSRAVGLDIIRAIKLRTNSRFNKYLIMIDDEHISDDSQIERKFKEYGFNIEDKQYTNGLLVIDTTTGSNQLRCFLTILGRNCIYRNVEHHIVKLIELKLGVKIEVDRTRVKDKIRSVLRDYNTTIEKLIIESSNNILKNAFPQLYQFFSII